MSPIIGAYRCITLPSHVNIKVKGLGLALAWCLWSPYSSENLLEYKFFVQGQYPPIIEVTEPSNTPVTGTNLVLWSLKISYQLVLVLNASIDTRGDTKGQG